MFASFLPKYGDFYLVVGGRNPKDIKDFFTASHQDKDVTAE